MFRPLESRDDLQQCVELQRETWGAEFTELVPPSILMIAQKVGGVAAGAFDRDGRLLGFVFGLSGVRDRRPAHWSDMLAVRVEARGMGLARRLKEYQRDQLRRNGIEVAYWTFDPLEARNAHLNMNRLGVRPVEYVPDMYGSTRSELHAGLGTDRFIVEWELDHPRVEAALRGHLQVDLRRAREAPIVTATPKDPREPGGPELADAELVRIEIPADIQRLKAERRDVACRWRETTRGAFLHYMERGYRVEAFYRDRERCFYVLERAER